MIPLHQQNGSLIRANALLLMLSLFDKIAMPALPQHIRPGRKQLYGDRLFLKAAVIMTLKKFSRVYELLTTIDEPTVEMQHLRQHLTQGQQMPTRPTLERQLTDLAEILPSIIAWVGALLVVLLDVWQESTYPSNSTVVHANCEIAEQFNCTKC